MLQWLQRLLCMKPLDKEKMNDELRNSVYYRLIERRDSTNPKSLRGVGPYGPYGPYGPEAAIQNPKLGPMTS